MKNTTTKPAVLARLGEDEGATAAEYAITILAGCAFAAVVFGVLTSEPIRELVLGIITKALGMAG